MSVPSAPAFDGVLCYPDVDIDPDGYGIVGTRGTPRATAQGRYARMYGCDFADLTCRRAFIRLWTRQEAWEYQGNAGTAPADWQVPDGTPAYEFVGPDFIAAQPVWLVEPR
jgi:hypothetical protein